MCARAITRRTLGFSFSRFGNIDVSFDEVAFVLNLSILHSNRTPFQPSTTFRCAVLAIFQFLPTIYNYLAFRLAFSAIIESILYIKTFIADVKLLLNEVDRLATNGESEAPLLELCKTAIEMHCQVYE